MKRTAPDYRDFETITIEKRGRVLHVTFNRPEVLNAVNEELHVEMANIFYQINTDPTVDIVVLSGAGRAFCAGGDAAWMQREIDDPTGFDHTVLEAKRVIFSILDCEKPIICRMNGDAVGLGATIALYCDMIVAADHARIGDPHVKVGLVAGDGSTIIWPQLIGFCRAKEYLMTGRLIDAKDAAQIGLINYAVPAAELDAKVNELVDRLLNLPAKAVRWTKVSVNVALKQLAHSSLDTALAYEALSNLTADRQEGVASFREKRKPKFIGR